jgi:Ca2+-binding EF-hand superfamily protein
MIEDVKVIKDVFDLFDIDENDQIDKNELKQAFEIVGSDAR